MHYLSVEGLTKSFGIKPLFTNITFNISEGDKVAIVARNGAGKTTLMRIIAGKDTAEGGKCWVNKEVKVSYLDQDPEFDNSKSVIENIFEHQHPVMNVVKDYELLLEDGESADYEKLSEVMGKMDEMGAWDFESKVQQILGKLNIHNLHQLAGTLSGGQRKRLALAKVLIDLEFEENHNLLILDEPTNHLDFAMIEWLEDFLSDQKITLILVTHDRYFLDNVCNQIIEMEDQQLFVWKGNYQNFLEKKAERDIADQATLEKTKNTYRRELEWMRKQPKARTVKSKSRQDAFVDIEDKATARREDLQLELNVKMTRLGGKILELKKVHKSYGDKAILKGYDYSFKRGERVGIIGKNGVGKTTFLNILLGLEHQDSGKINTGETVVFGYFSQQGLVLKEDMRVIEFVKDIAEHFPLADGTKVSASQFLLLFQFSGEQQHTFISKLSGGERKRLQLLSILFKNPNFLILDEPTNDLDLVTLGVLEEFLQSYQGCVIVVSHDRYFMDKLIDHLFVFEGEGVITDFPGTYSQYRVSLDKKKSDDREEKVELKAKTEKAKAEQKAPESKPAPNAPAPKRKLSFKEKFEFEQLEKDIPALQTEKAIIENKMSNDNIAFDELQQLTKRLTEVIALLDEKEMRWLEYSME